jgi:hypothetical protein
VPEGAAIRRRSYSEKTRNNTSTPINGGTLILGGSIENVAGGSAGIVETVGSAGSLIELDHADISGGFVLGDAGGGGIEVTSDATLDGGADSIQVAGTFAVDAGATLLVLGAILGNAATLDPGAGTLVLTGADISFLTDLAGGANIMLVGALSTIDNGATLGNGIVIDADQALDFNGTVTNASTIALAGSLEAGVNHGATMDVATSASFTGGGTIDLSNQADLIAGGGSAQITFDTQTILGIGTIDGLSKLNVTAGATLEASGGTLVVDAATITNLGFVGAAAGSTVSFTGWNRRRNSSRRPWPELLPA